MLPSSDPTTKQVPSGENFPSKGLLIVYFSYEYMPYSRNYLIKVLVFMFHRHISPPSLPEIRISSILGCAARTKEQFKSCKD
jgi:hypothetical protein